jgi:hypothetical protein
MVIEFAVVGDPARTVLVRHGLGTGGGEIDYRKPAMAETEAAVEVKAFGIRPAVSQGSGHAPQKVAVNGPVGFGVMKNSYDTAHWT